MHKKNIKKLVIAIAVTSAFVILALKNKLSHEKPIDSKPQKQEEVMINPNAEIIDAIKKSAPLKYTTVKNAKVIHMLPDDKTGPLHQRWIMEIENGLTITVFHNVDIAERVPVVEGSYITVAGELEYGDRWKDPIMHWTHDDPQGHRKAGYVILNGTTYGHATGP